MDDPIAADDNVRISEQMFHPPVRPKRCRPITIAPLLSHIERTTSRCLSHRRPARFNIDMSKSVSVPAAELIVRQLDVDTWPAFARLVEANNGVWGGCWCVGFHVKLGKGRTVAQNRAEKEQRVREGRTHAALVFAGDECLGWCQFGSPEELPEVKSRRRYEAGLSTLPDWRITCFFTGKGRRRRGVANAALGGALAEIARSGGGTVEGYPEETDDRTLSGSFLHTGPMAAFENHGFVRTRPIAPHRWVVTRHVEPA